MKIVMLGNDITESLSNYTILFSGVFLGDPLYEDSATLEALKSNEYNITCRLSSKSAVTISPVSIFFDSTMTGSCVKLKQMGILH